MYKAVLSWIVLSAAAAANAQTLHVYGPGGPLAPMKECAELYSRQTHQAVQVTAGPERQWFAAAYKNADIIFDGADYMLTQFDQQHPGFLESGSRSELYRRAIGILVRKGNPKHIAALTDLIKPGIKILDVNGAGQLGVWEDLAGRNNDIEQLQKHIALSVADSADGTKQWNANLSFDAWITYASWQKRLSETTDLVEFPPEQKIYRGTPIAIAERSEHKKAAVSFLRFLKTDQAHAIFTKWGWE